MKVVKTVICDFKIVSIFLRHTHRHTKASLIIFHNLKQRAVILFKSCSNLSVSDDTLSIPNPNQNLKEFQTYCCVNEVLL